jgi:ABC-type multidrug transport system fused ATPase/permease subunit
MGERVRDILSEETSSKTDLMYEILYNPEFVPVPSSKVGVKINLAVEGKTSYLMKNYATGLYYESDELTNLIWTLTDGKRTVKEIVAEAQNRNPKLKEDDVVGLLLFFAEANLLVSSFGPVKKKRVKVMSSFQIDYTLIEQSNKFVQSIHNKLRPIFKRALLWATVIFIIIAAVLFAGRFVSIFGHKSNFQLLGSSVVGFFFYYFVALAPVIAVHEISHGLALVHYGGEPGEMGTGLFYFGPMFYVETTDIYGLKKRDRIMVSLAGNISTLLIGSIVVFILLFVTFPHTVELIVTMIAFYCFDMALFNFAPPFETDGYGVLTDALNMPNLRPESYGYMGSLIKRVFGAKKLKAPEMTRRKKGIMVGYTMLSVGWIIYIVFQTALFLTYMSQDFTASLSKIFHALWTSQALSVAAVVIAMLSVVYFGMQVVGYGSFFLTAAKKAFKKPLRIEAIHDRTLSVFAYLPPQAPESLARNLRSRMEKNAKKFTHNFEIKQAGRSCIALLRMGGTSLAFTQIQASLKRVEDEFSAAYEKLILNNKDELQKSIGINSPAKMKLTRLLEHVAAESVSSGNSGALAVVKACEEKQKETILYLLTSAFGTVWTIEVQPAHEYELQREIVPAMLLEDLTLTDLYGDCENFKKSTVYGFDSLAELAEETEIGLKKSLAQPQEYQAVGIFQPIKSRITFIGRTGQLEKKIDMFAPYFVAETWSGYLDNLLTETCYTLYALNKTRLPEAKEIREMSTGELAVLANDLSEFGENQEFVEKYIQGSEETLSKLNQSLREVREAIKPSDNFEIGLLDATFNVNLENLEALPGRIKDFRKEWKVVCKEVDRIRKHVDDELENRKAETDQKKHNMLKVYPAIIAISVLFGAFGFLPLFATLWIPMLSIALIAQALYWLTFYRTWSSFHRVSKYPSQAFGRIHLLTLAWTEAIYKYVTTGNILASSENTKE